MKICFALITALTAAPALACPTRADVEGAGVSITYDDGSVTHYRQVRRGVILEDTIFAPDSDDGFWLEALFGLHSVGYGDLKGDVRSGESEFIRYPGLVPPPRPGMTWAENARIENAAGQEVDRVRIEIEMGALQPIEIGACQYMASPSTVRSTYIEGDDTVTFDFVPDLGIAVLTGEGSSADGMSPLVATAISASK